ncbi:hypothetical protein [Halalkalibacterium halodurans]|uniref:hypothetical protein n=1 Tax=Halalkalibacterium halodurans TaxID=86665 RepID=UPI002AA9B4E6|nr:hypothetical protein [Halalkalibacterium halodurans]MDY7221209.1 hypothetical protein [Halalkalibacterium halodurans]MDY7240448.1 hypothetical protein [Halalkalibacterium halodurans]
MQIKPPDNVLVGTIGDMKTNIDGNTIQFLVGTMNHDTYKEDVYKITIFCKGEKDVIKLRYE